jgi:CBS-domain-containing membrane protein
MLLHLGLIIGKYRKMNAFSVKDFISYSDEEWISETKPLSDALKKMKKLELECLSVVNDKMSIIGVVKREDLENIAKNKTERYLNNTQISSFLNIKNKSDYFYFYPNMEITEAYSLMKNFNMKTAVVIDYLWDRKFLGWLHLDRIENFV